MATPQFFSCQSIFLLLLVNVIATSGLTPFEFSDCGSQGVTVEKIDMEPSPFVYPGSISGTMKATVTRTISSFNMTLKIVRTISGIKLPISCYLPDGNPVGSCTYSSEVACAHIQYWNTEEVGSYVWMTPIMRMLGQAVKCPENIIDAKRIDIVNETFEMPDLTQNTYQPIATGDFEVIVTVKESSAQSAGPFFCGTFKYTLMKKK